MRISVVMTAIPTRTDRLAKALASVANQTRKPDEIIVRFDHERRGAAHNRHCALLQATGDLVAFLDDDDEFLPHHLGVLEEAYRAHKADLVYPWFEVVGGTDPFPMFEGKPWNPAEPHQVPITFLASTKALLSVGGFMDEHTYDDVVETDEFGNRAGEDYRLIRRLNDAGAKIVHVHQRTWKWHHHSGNSSGLPSRVPW